MIEINGGGRPNRVSEVSCEGVTLGRVVKGEENGMMRGRLVLGWGRGDKRDLLDCMIRAIDMVICFPKGINGRIITCMSVLQEAR